MASSASWAVVRELFHKSSSSSSSSATTNHTCELPNPLVETPTETYANGYTFHQLGSIIAGCGAAFAILSIFILMFRHATHLSKPNEQLKILRICLLIPINSLVQLIGQLAPASYFYLTPWADLMQSFALGNFFLLLLEFISPHDTQREFFFSGLQVPSKKSGRAPKDGLRWYRRKWMAIFQYPIVQFIVCIATDVTQSPHLNLYCENSNKPYFAHLWLNLFHILSMVTAVVSCLRFYKILKSELVGHKPLSKLFAFKLMVGINFLMTIIFWILDGLNPSPLTPSSMMSQADVTVGIPAIVNCLIMVPFSIFFHYAYDVGPYIIGGSKHHPENGGTQHYHPQQYQGGFLGIRAFAGMINPRELLGAIGFVFKMGPPNKAGGSSAAAPGRYNAPNGYQGGGHNGGYAHEMSRREQRRMDKHSNRAGGESGGGGYYANNSNTDGYSGQQQQQNGGYYQNGGGQQNQRGYR